MSALSLLAQESENSCHRKHPKTRMLCPMPCHCRQQTWLLCLVSIALAMVSLPATSEGLEVTLEAVLPIDPESPPGSASLRRLAGGEAHLFTIDLEVDDVLDVVVEQQGIDLKIELLDAAGDVAWIGDNPFGDQVPETMFFLATVAGSYAVRLSPWGADATPASYLLRARLMRPANEQQRLLAEAHRRHGEAYRLYRQRSAQNLRQAVDGFARAAEAWQRLGEEDRAAEARYRQGVIQRRLGDPDAATASLEVALRRFLDISYRRGQAAVYNQLGTIYKGRSETEQAMRSYRRAAELWRHVGDADGEVKARGNLGVLLYLKREYDEALAIQQAAALHYERRGQTLRQSVAMLNMGGIHADLGELAAAEELYESALDLTRQAGDQRQEATCLGSLGVLYRRQGEMGRARQHLEAALALHEAIGSRRRRGDVLINLSALYLRLRLPRKGLDHLRQALEYLPKEDRGLRARVLNMLGQAHTALEQPARARIMFDKSLVLRQEIGDKPGEIRSRVGLARLLLNQGQPAEALHILRPAQRFETALEGTSLETSVLLEMAHAETDLAQTATAGQHFRQVIVLSGSTGRRHQEAQARYGLARLARLAGDVQGAAEQAWRAMELSESVLAGTVGERQRSAWLAYRRPIYEFAVSALVDASRQVADPAASRSLLHRAFEATERAHARGLERALQESGDDWLTPQESDLGDEVRQLRWRRRALEEATQQGDGATEDSSLEELRARWDVLEEKLQAIDPRRAEWLRPREVRLEEVQGHLLDEETLLLEFMLSSDRSFLWLAGKNLFEVYELPPGGEIEDVARRAHTLLQRADPTEGAEQRAILARLGRMLLTPVADQLGQKRLVIVPDGGLHYLPFAALEDPRHPGEPLMMRHETVRIPSMAVLRQLRREVEGRPSGQRLLAVVADPVFDPRDPRVEMPVLSSDPPTSEMRFERLIASGEEASAIAAVGRTGRAEGPQVSPDVLMSLGFDSARKPIVEGLLSSYQVVHFATHGIIDSRHPERSGLMLSTVDERGRPIDGLLSLQDIYSLRLDADLVVLSACETALGQEVQGEGLLSLTRGFFYAGVPSIVSSLWTIRDRATATLMRHFYHHLLIDGDGPSKALRKAQIFMWQQRSSRDPYFWAPFVLEGDWQGGVQ